MDGQTYGRTNEGTNERTDIRITIYPRNFVCGGYKKYVKLFETIIETLQSQAPTLIPSLNIFVNKMVKKNAYQYSISYKQIAIKQNLIKVTVIPDIPLPFT